MVKNSGENWNKKKHSIEDELQTKIIKKVSIINKDNCIAEIGSMDEKANGKQI